MIPSLSIARYCTLALTIFSHPATTGSISIGLSRSAPVVDVGYSKYQGIAVVDPVTNATNINFIGIRFAAPPTGDLRFQMPHAPASTLGTLIADTEPNRCFDAHSGTQPTTPFPNPIKKRHNLQSVYVPPYSEDCLFLNVYTPESSQSLPVVVWIHGGGYISGSASGFTGTDISDGNDLIREAGGGVVVVIIQYRLGLFGFLPGQKIKDEGVLNAGLLDQQYALRWVRKHISKFGGNPNHVTLWGESAGAGSVLQQLVANDGNTKPPLFRAAITSSTFLPSQYRYNDPIPETLYNEVVAQTNCTDAVNTLSCLRSVDVNVLRAVNVNINDSGFFGTFLFVPVVDGTFITERPTKLLKQGKVNADVLYSVTNTFEGAAFVDSSTQNTVQVGEYLAQLFPNLAKKEIIEAQKQYSGLGDNLSQVVAIMGESIFICPTYYLLRAFGSSAFKGEFAIPPGGHGNDLAYYWPSQNANGVPPYGNPQFVNAFAQSFLNFALSDDPNAKWDKSNITPMWRKWAFRGTEMLFNRTEAGAPDIRPISTSSALLNRCAFWESVSASTGQ